MRAAGRAALRSPALAPDYLLAPLESQPLLLWSTPRNPHFSVRMLTAEYSGPGRGRVADRETAAVGHRTTRANIDGRQQRSTPTEEQPSSWSPRRELVDVFELSSAIPLGVVVEVG